jgi:two-component system, OmpR family, sensor kinase
MRPGYKARLAGWHAAILAVILGLSALALDWTVRRAVLDQFDAALLHAAQSVAAEIADEGPTGPVPAMPVKPIRRLLWSFRPIIQVVHEDGRVATLIGAHQALPLPPSVLDGARRGKVVFKTQRAADSRGLRMVALGATSDGERYGVLVAHPLDDLYVLLRRTRLLIAGAAVAALVAILLTDVILTRRVLRPIDAIVRRARTLSETNLAERLPHPDEPGEVGRLVETLNEMLARLHHSFDAQRRFTADAAHELRSPLTRLRTEMEVALRRPRDAEEYRSILEVSLEEIQRLGWLTENLLALARLDAGEGRETGSGSVLLAPVVDGIVARFESAARGRGLALGAKPGGREVAVNVLPGIVDAILTNLVDNAVKFSPAGGGVELDVLATGTDAIVTVTDHGPGIAEDELPHVFDRFFRGRVPRAGGAAGVGLGLAIAKTLVERQHGAIWIDSKPGLGTTVTVRLPLAPASPA